MPMTEAEITIIRDRIAEIEKRISAVGGEAQLQVAKDYCKAVFDVLDDMRDASPYQGMLFRFYLEMRLALKSQHDNATANQLFDTMERIKNGF